MSTSLRKTLREPHVNMIAFSACFGVGLFMQSGKVVNFAGPGMAVISYIVMGTVMSSAMACLGEMTALFPIQGPLFEFPRRFLDEGIGFSVGWVSWFAWTVIIAAEVLTVVQLWDFNFTPDYLREVGYPHETLNWPAGQSTSPAVWVVMFTLIIGLINLLPVRQYGQLEFAFGTLKIAFVGVILFFNVIENSLQADEHGGRFWTYNKPYSFVAQNHTLRVIDGEEDQVLTGGAGQLAGVWSAMTIVIWSMLGFETVAITAAENQELERDETVKIGTRKIAIRIIILYTLCVLVVGFNVPYTDPNLIDAHVDPVRSGQNSIFVVAAVRSGVLHFPGVMNGFFIFAAVTAGVNALYNSSRLLHALSHADDAWPDIGVIRSFQYRLQRTWAGVPLVSVFVSWLFGLLGFLSTKSQPFEVLGRIVTNSSVSMMIVYSCVCLSYLVFYKTINEAAAGHGPKGPSDTIESDLQNLYNRDAPRYPYKSHLQWLRACYGFFGCSMITLFNGWRSFVTPMSVADFIASYISVAVFVAIAAAYHVKSDGYNPLYWGFHASKQIRLPRPLETIEEDPKQRRGVFHLSDEDDLFTRKNIQGLRRWGKVWMSW